MCWRTLVALLLALTLLGGFYSALQAAPAPHVTSGGALPINLSNSLHAFTPDIAQATDGTIYVVWSDDKDGKLNIFIASSTDDGQTWSNPMPVDATVYDSRNPSLVVSGTLPRVAWADEIGGLNYRLMQNDVGEGTSLIIPTAYNQVAVKPALAGGPDGDLHLVFTGKRSIDGTTSVLYSRRPPGASAWSTATVVYSLSGWTALNPALAISADGSVLHATWNGNVGSFRYPMYISGTIGITGVTWFEEQTIPPDTLIWEPDIAVAPNGDVHVVWSQRLGDRTQIYLHYNRREGGSWQGTVDIGGGIPYEVNENNPYGLKSAIAVSADGSMICAAWNAYPSAAATAEDIFLTCSADGGETWSPRENISRSPAKISIRPALLIDAEGIVHVVWQEQTGSDPNNDFQIYYTRRLGHKVCLPLVRRGG